MKFVGHTMGTPNQSVAEAFRLYADAGLDAIEIVAQEGGKFWIDAPQELVDEVMNAAAQVKAEGKLTDGVITLTPYYWHINHSDPKVRQDNIEGLKRAILMAKAMGAKFVRSYGGVDNAGGTMEENWDRAVDALKQVAPLAEENDIIVLVENHPGTMTRTGEDTAKLLREVGSTHVLALYDPANVMHDTKEPWEYTYDVQRGLIGYVHVKDFFMEGTTRKACSVGKGIVPWDKIMAKLKADGYEGYCSFEYEKRWYPDQLEDAEIGVPECINYLNSVM